MRLKKIKVSIIEPVGGHGGLEFYDLGLCESIVSQGIEVTFYTCEKTKLQEKYDHKYRVLHTFKGVFGRENKIIRGLRYLKGTLISLIDSRKCNSSIAHFHLFHFSLLEYFNLFVFRMFKFGIVATIHDVESLDKFHKKITGKKYKKFAKIIDQIIVHNSFTRSELLEKVPLFNESKIHIVPPTDLDFIYNKEVSRLKAREILNLNIPENSNVVLFFGQIKKTKGLDILVKAFAKLKKRDTYLLIVGRAWKTDLNYYHDLIEELNISDRTILNLKYIGNKEVMLYFKASDVVVLPYLKVYNSSVLLRAMDYGSIPVVSDLNVFKEIITDGFNGFIFKKGCYDDLSSVLSKVLSNDMMRERIEIDSMKYVKDHYSFDVIGEKLGKIYEIVLDER